MVTFMPQNPNQGRSGLGDFLSQGLSGLAQNKLQQIAQRNQAQQQQQAIGNQAKFWEQAGLSPDFSRALATQPEAIQKSVLDRLEGLQLGQAPAESHMNNLLQFLQGQPSESQLTQPVTSQQQSQEPIQRTGIKLGANPVERRHQQQMEHAERLTDKKLAQQKELVERKEKHELSKHELERFEKEQDKSKDFLKSVNKESKGIKENLMRLDKMEQLIKSGNLSSPAFSAFLDTISNGLWGVGINLKFLQSPETQEFEKLSKDMLSGLKDIFGSRILESEVQNFLQTIPNLSQSNEGKQAVINNMRLLSEGKLLRQQLAREIIKENDNVVPADLEVLVEEKAEPYLDEIADRFKNAVHFEAKPEEEFTTGPLGFKWKKETPKPEYYTGPLGLKWRK